MRPYILVNLIDCKLSPRRPNRFRVNIGEGEIYWYIGLISCDQNKEDASCRLHTPPKCVYVRTLCCVGVQFGSLYANRKGQFCQEKRKPRVHFEQ